MEIADGKEIFKLLKEKLEIPDGVIYLELKIGLDIVPEILCKYHPQKATNEL